MIRASHGLFALLISSEGVARPTAAAIFGNSTHARLFWGACRPAIRRSYRSLGRKADVLLGRFCHRRDPLSSTVRYDSSRPLDQGSLIPRDQNGARDHIFTNQSRPPRRLREPATFIFWLLYVFPIQFVTKWRIFPSSGFGGRPSRGPTAVRLIIRPSDRGMGREPGQTKFDIDLGHRISHCRPRGRGINSILVAHVRFPLFVGRDQAIIWRSCAS